ncbi:hypothetical protein NADFUDRAFT_83295 [Nadsonia fulvescens var. elongata DSM 6958]|uniref:Uncharacterized protein n=1 Tax=Nadsonia fulvescens var. elongata DSM 6958 TaxID=857566 RepID=A0A1E3PK02_9ASCO|nr:hypothetical protein NADFUDRAFT_83295 [Nadsonia fulvescens var. elongata DSM 6958]
MRTISEDEWPENKKEAMAFLLNIVEDHSNEIKSGLLKKCSSHFDNDDLLALNFSSSAISNLLCHSTSIHRKLLAYYFKVMMILQDPEKPEMLCNLDTLDFAKIIRQVILKI